MYSIGEFSRITGLTVKALRFYHDQGVLTPTYVDKENGYRYYAESKVEIAHTIKRLRGFEFTLAQISEILKNHEDDEDILVYLHSQKERVSKQEARYRNLRRSLDDVIRFQQIARQTMNAAEFDITEKQLDSILIAGIRMKGKYSDCGRSYGRIARKFGRHLCGKPLMIHFDCEYKQDDADFEAAMPIKKGESNGDITVRSLEGGRAVTLIHKGPYEELGRSYQRVMEHLKKQNLSMKSPTREVYLKGPGMIFRGNPKKYLTEIQILVD